jgi:hypothetical protein
MTEGQMTTNRTPTTRQTNWKTNTITLTSNNVKLANHLFRVLTEKFDAGFQEQFGGLTLVDNLDIYLYEFLSENPDPDDEDGIAAALRGFADHAKERVDGLVERLLRAHRQNHAGNHADLPAEPVR